MSPELPREFDSKNAPADVIPVQPLQAPAVAKKKGLAVAGGADKPGCGAVKQKPAAKSKIVKKDKSEKKAKVDKKDGGAKPPYAKSAYQFFCAAERGALITAVEHSYPL